MSPDASTLLRRRSWVARARAVWAAFLRAVNGNHLDRFLMGAVVVGVLRVAIPFVVDPVGHARTWTFAYLDQQVSLVIVGWVLIGLAVWLGVAALSRKPWARLAPAALLGIACTYIAAKIADGTRTLGAPDATGGLFHFAALVCLVVVLSAYLPKAPRLERPAR